MNKSLIVEIVKKSCPAVITIVVSKDLPKIEGYYFFPFAGQEFIAPTEKEKTKINGGSGFIVSSDGHVITSGHVVADTKAKYSVILGPGKKYPLKVISRDPINDIAILKIIYSSVGVKDFPFLNLGDSDRIELGEEVLAIGNALGEFHDTISFGIISGMSRVITAFSGIDGQTNQLRGLIQTDAAINPGNSGGPLINMNGEVIGINTAAAIDAQNIGFAIPINYAKKDLEEIMRYGKIKRPFLGIKYIILNKEIAKYHKLPINYGALITREMLGEEAIIKKSSASKAGLKEYDIILEINGEKITWKNPLANILQKYKINQEILLKVLRGKKKMNIKVKLEEKK